MSGSLLKFKKTYSVKIGGRQYPVVKIGNQLWLAENLKYHTTVDFKYPNGSTDNEERYGLLYNSDGMDEIKSLNLSGYRMPSYSDIETLCTSFSDNYEALLDSSSDIWGGIGTNLSGFSAVPSGSYNNGSVSYNVFGSEQIVWTDTLYPSPQVRYCRMGIGAGFVYYTGSAAGVSNYFSIRLVKDAT